VSERRFDVDSALLLIARGASMAEVGEWFGVAGRTIERWLHKPELAQARRDAIEARPFLRSNHGTASRYNAGCRCVACREAQREQHKVMRRRKSPPEHGTPSAYRNHGCRCDECRAAGIVANKETLNAIASGAMVLGHGSAQRFADGCRCVVCVYACERRAASVMARQERTVDGAHHARQQWTGAELEIALARNPEGGWLRSSTEVARILGRTYFAVQVKRSRERDPRVGGIAGL
jgi:hypothetical protein